MSEQASQARRASPGSQSSPEEFFRTELRVGRVVKAEEFPAARRPAYRLLVDFGPTSPPAPACSEPRRGPLAAGPPGQRPDLR